MKPRSGLSSDQATALNAGTTTFFGNNVGT